jgi:putative endonuclease
MSSHCHLPLPGTGHTAYSPGVRDYYVYIMTNNSGTLYVGVTNNLIRRVTEHKSGATKGFTSRYKMTRLVYFEVGGDALAAIEREKQIKGWVRRRSRSWPRRIPSGKI